MSILNINGIQTMQSRTPKIVLIKDLSFKTSKNYTYLRFVENLLFFLILVILKLIKQVKFNKLSLIK